MSFDIIFENRIKAILGTEFDDFINALSNEKTGAIRVNNLKGTLEDLEALDITLDGNVLWEKQGYIYTSGAPGKHSLHEAGAYYIQEPSAMSPVYFLDPQPGEKILDLCAAPGGKSTQIACRMNGEGILVTNEIDKKRAQILSLNIERLGIKNALVTNMKPQGLSDYFEGYFDKILVDAPCSGEGMFRKNDEAIENWSLQNVELCAKRQTEILKEAVKMLAPGGRLVYSTCTFAPEEDELQAAELISWGLEPIPIAILDGMKKGDISNLKKVTECQTSLNFFNEFLDGLSEEIKQGVSECSARLWPHKVRGEGHFLAVLKKDGDITLNRGLYGVNGKVKTANENDIKLFKEFADQYLKDVQFKTDDLDTKKADSKDRKAKARKAGKAGKGGRNNCRLEGALKGTPFMFGDNLYLAPEGMPGINGLTVMRPGLHLGTIKNGRFEPSHSLALAMKEEDVVLAYDLGNMSDSISEQSDDTINKAVIIDDSKAMQFIGGMSFREPGLKDGWYLVTTYGYSLGWAKYAGGVLKNHYPKGLRIYT